jgi:hypothetical protein
VHRVVDVAGAFVVAVVVAVVAAGPDVVLVDGDDELLQAESPNAKATDASPNNAERVLTLPPSPFVLDRYSIPRPHSNRFCGITFETVDLFNRFSFKVPGWWR